jgi:hypothetical protein
MLSVVVGHLIRLSVDGRERGRWRLEDLLDIFVLLYF